MLELTGYDRYYSLDISLHCEYAISAATKRIRWLKALRALIRKIDMEKIQQIIKLEDAIETLALIREAMLGN